MHDRERLLAHLVDCSDCRREVAELRHVRSLLTGSTDPGLTPVDLSDRLVSIAGEEATEPLWTRPFRRAASGGELPSRRHLMRTRVLAGVLGCSLTVLAVLGIGYVIAPADSASAALDPTHRAVTEFTTVVSAFPLDGRVSAALQGRPARPVSRSASPTSVALPAKRLSEAKDDEAADPGRARRRSADLLGHPDRRLTVTRNGSTNVVRISSLGSAGTELSPAGSGHRAGARHLRRVGLVDPDGRRRPDRSPRRPATRCGAGSPSRTSVGPRTWSKPWSRPLRPAEGSLDGVAARWWLDARTGLLLGQETYDGRGNLVVSSRLTDLRFGAVTDQSSLAAGPAARTTATLTLSRAGQLRRDGWVCAERLAGLSLLRLRTDQTDDPTLRAPRLQRRADHPERGRAARTAGRGTDRQHPQRDPGRLGHRRDAEHGDLDLG